MVVTTKSQSCHAIKLGTRHSLRDIPQSWYDPSSLHPARSDASRDTGALPAPRATCRTKVRLTDRQSQQLRTP